MLDFSDEIYDLDAFHSKRTRSQIIPDDCAVQSQAGYTTCAICRTPVAIDTAVYGRPDYATVVDGIPLDWYCREDASRMNIVLYPSPFSRLR